MLSPASPSSEALLRHNLHALSVLRRRWLLVTLGYAAASLAGFLILQATWRSDTALRWLLLTALFSLRPIWLLWHYLDENHRRHDARLLPGLGYGNAATLARGWCLAAVGGFFGAPLLTGWLAWLPAMLYLTAVILDGVDGYIARITDHSTKLGERLDISLDAWGLLTAVLVAVWFGQLPLWYLPLGFSRELFLAGQWWLQRRGRPVHGLTPSTERRAIAGLQMGFMVLILSPLLRAPATVVAAALFGAQLGLSFLRDWLVVSGAIDPTSPGYQTWRLRAKRLLQDWLPVPLRLFGAGLAAALLLQLAPGFVRWLPAGVMTSPVALAGLWSLTAFWGMAVVLLALGVTPRLAACALLALALLDQHLAGFDWTANGLLQITTILVIQLGGGRWAFWRADDALWHTRAGEQIEDPS